MSAFYDDLAPLYHLIFADWDASMLRQGRALSEVIQSRWSPSARVVDVSCGIGTQALALAALGYRVTASDLSQASIERARREAGSRKLDVSFSVCDMRDAFAHHGGGFDIVICCDNAIPHLLDDDDIAVALRQMLACLRPGGGCILTVRDYDPEPRGKCLLKPVQCAVRGDVRTIVTQVWDFDDDGTHYDFAMYFTEERIASGAIATRVMRARYYAIGIPKLMALIESVGFEDVTRLDGAFYQPVIVATKPL